MKKLVAIEKVLAYKQLVITSHQKENVKVMTWLQRYDSIKARENFQKNIEMR
jgi:hypothetical protein